MVATDGSADFVDLADAIDATGERGAVLIRAGVYTLSRPVVIDRTMTIQGEGSEETFIEVPAQRWGLWLQSSSAHLLLEGVTLRATKDCRAEALLVCGPGRLEANDVALGPSRADVSLSVQTMSRVSLTRCVFRDHEAAALRAEGAVQLTLQACRVERGESGVEISGQARAAVDRCVFEHQRRGALRVEGSASLEMQDCQVRDNGGHGLLAADRSTATVSRVRLEGNRGCGVCLQTSRYASVIDNFMSQNGEDGLLVTGTARVKVELNTCTRNERNGLAFLGEVEGELAENVCSQNGWSGIQAGDRVRLRAQQNLCRFNKRHGMMVLGRAQVGVARGNCSHNGDSGVLITDQADIALDRVELTSNGGHGAVWWKDSGGTAEHNTLRDNKRHGLTVMGRASPHLVRNECTNNRQSGLAVLDTAHPRVEHNTFSGNAEHGVVVCDSGKPMLSQNLVERNEAAGVFLRHRAGGVARGNVGRLNRGHDLRLEDRVETTLVDNDFGRVERFHSSLTPPDALLRAQTAVPLMRPREASAPMTSLVLTHGFVPMVAGLICTLPALLAGMLLYKLSVPLLTLLVALSGLSLVFWGRMALNILRAHALLRDGVVVFGVITRVEPTTREVQAVYDDVLGQPHTITTFLSRDALLDTNSVGTKIALLVDPEHPSEVVIPSMIHAVFKAPPEVAQDQRPARLPPSPQEHALVLAEGARGSFELLSSLEPVRYPSLVRLLTPRQVRVGLLSLKDEGLSVRLHSAARERLIPWSKPFSVVLSAWLLEDEMAELNLALRLQGAPSSSPVIKFKTRLPQAALSHEIDLKQEHCPWLAPEDFPPLWRRLVATSRLHGAQLQGLIDLEALQGSK